MKLCIFTIVLDGMPWITKHLPIFQQLKCDWRWIVVEGASSNNGSTRWCKPQVPRLSNDGTTEYLWSIRNEPNVTLIQKPIWNSKDDMCNAALEEITEPCVLMEIDADEIWQPWQLDNIVEFFRSQEWLDSIQFPCRYFVGENLITEGHHCYGDMDYEWWRAWRYTPGVRFESHEPPRLTSNNGRNRSFDKPFCLKHGLVFDHYAYATEPQVRYKEQWYGRNREYDGLLDGWRRLQKVKDFPVKLSDYFPQVKGDLPLVVKI